MTAIFYVLLSNGVFQGQASCAHGKCETVLLIGMDYTNPKWTAVSPGKCDNNFRYKIMGSEKIKLKCINGQLKASAEVSGVKE